MTPKAIANMLVRNARIREEMAKLALSYAMAELAAAQAEVADAEAKLCGTVGDSDGDDGA